MRDDVSMGGGTSSGSDVHGGGGTAGVGSHHGGGTATGTGRKRGTGAGSGMRHHAGTFVGSGAVWQAVQDLARVGVALVFVLALSLALGAIVRELRPTPVHAAVLVTSQGEVLPSAGSCDQDAAWRDVDNLHCPGHLGPR